MKNEMFYGRDWSAATLDELEVKIDTFSGTTRKGGRGHWGA